MENQPKTDRITELLFLALILSLGFMRPSFNVGGLSVTVTDVMFLMTGLAWSTAFLLGKVRPRFDPAFYCFLIYAAALLLSVFFSENTRASAIKFPAEIYLIGLAVLTFYVVTTREMVRNVILAWLAASAVTSLVGTLTVLSYYLGLSNFITSLSLHHYGSLPPGNYPRIQSTFFYPSMLCNYLTVSVMILFAAFKLDWIQRSAFIFLLIVFGITIAFTLTPGIGGVILAVGLWFWVDNGGGSRAWGKLALAAGSLAALLFLLVSSFSLLHSPTSPYHFDLAGVRVEPTQRLLTWQGAAGTFLNDPVFGRGLGLAAANVTFMPPSGQVQLLTDAHNAFLNVAAQAGILGLASLVLVAAVFARRGYADRSDPLLTALGIAFISAFIYQSLVGSFEEARHLWVLMGLILAVSRMSDQSARVSNGIN